MNQVDLPNSVIPVGDILQELKRAEAKFPRWPTDVVHGAAIVVEEAGESLKAANELFWESERIVGEIAMASLREELIQTAAMACRMINYLDRFGEDVIITAHD